MVTCSAAKDYHKNPIWRFGHPQKLLSFSLYLNNVVLPQTQGASAGCPFDQHQNIVLKCAYFVVTSTTECWHDQKQNAYFCSILLLVVSAFCCWLCQHSVVGHVSILLLIVTKNRHILIKNSVVGCSIFCCWSNGQLALVRCDKCIQKMQIEWQTV